MFWFIVLLLLAGAGFYFYQKMMEIEREIRAEQAAGQAASETAPPRAEPEKPAKATDEVATDSPIVTPEVEKMTSKAEPVPDASFSLEDEILAAVNNLPGVKQTDLYNSFADINKKQLQVLIKSLADEGKLKREKQGSSYLLYPA